MVALDEPKGKPYGGIVAAPVFSDVGSWALNHLNIAPSFPLAIASSPAGQARRGGPGHERAGQQNLSFPIEKNQGIVVLDPDLPGTIPDVKGLGVRDVLKKTKRLGLRLVVKGSGLAVEQSPAPGTPLEKHGLLTVTFRPPC